MVAMGRDSMRVRKGVGDQGLVIVDKFNILYATEY